MSRNIRHKLRMIVAISLGVGAVSLGVSLAYVYYSIRYDSLWDDTLQMSYAEKRRAFHLLRHWDGENQLYAISVPLPSETITVFVVEDTRTGVFGFCRPAASMNNTGLPYVRGDNAVRVTRISPEWSWVSLRKPHVLGLLNSVKENHEM